jgi:2-dehydropantoate 2-reductase
MQVLVLGAGVLGGYFGGKLLEGGGHVDFPVQPARAAQLEKYGLVVKTQDGEIRRRVRRPKPWALPSTPQGPRQLPVAGTIVKPPA